MGTNLPIYLPACDVTRESVSGSPNHHTSNGQPGPTQSNGNDQPINRSTMVEMKAVAVGSEGCGAAGAASPALSLNRLLKTTVDYVTICISSSQSSSSYRLPSRRGRCETSEGGGWGARAGGI